MTEDNGASSYRRFREEGDSDGLSEIIKLYMNGLIIYLTSIVGDVFIAEDLAEDTFVLLGTKKPKDKGNSSFKTWLYTIGRNLALDYLRKNKRYMKVDIDFCAEISDEEVDLEREFIEKERDIKIHRSLRKLKSDYRQILWLIYFEELSFNECAVIMKKSVHSLETMAYRARNALKKQLLEDGLTFDD